MDDDDNVTGSATSAEAQTEDVQSEPTGSDRQEDWCDRAIAEAEAEIAAEESAMETDDGDGASDDATKGGSTQSDDTAEDDSETSASPSPMIPKARLDEVLQHSQQLALEKARLEGLVEALKGQRTGDAAGAQQEHQPPQQPADPVQSLRNEQFSLAEQYDNGEMSTVDYQRALAKIDDQIYAIRVQQQQPDQRPSEFVQLAQEQLLEQHPAVQSIMAPQYEGLWTTVWAQAHQRMEQEVGQELPHYADMPPRLQIQMNKIAIPMAAQLAETMGISSSTTGSAAAPAKQSGTTRQQQPNPPLSPTAQARKQKLDLAQTMPPDVTQSGTSKSGPNELTDERIMAMSESEFNKLPPDLVDKLLMSGGAS